MDILLEVGSLPKFLSSNSIETSIFFLVLSPPNQFLLQLKVVKDDFSNYLLTAHRLLILDELIIRAINGKDEFDNSFRVYYSFGRPLKVYYSFVLRLTFIV